MSSVLSRTISPKSASAMTAMDTNGECNGSAPGLNRSNSILSGGKATSNGANEHVEEDREGRIRVGKDYQATIPDLITESHRRLDACGERALLLWQPAPPEVDDAHMEEYVAKAKEQYGYNAEQALGMLFWHRHDLAKAAQDLPNFTPFPDEWSVEDKVLFEQAYQFHGKSFHRIRQMLPDKSIGQLVRYYYGWKKTRSRTSLMDRQARRLQTTTETFVPKDEALAEKPRGGKETTTLAVDVSKVKRCSNCSIPCHKTHSTALGAQCGTCMEYYTRHGNLRPTSATVSCSKGKQSFASSSISSSSQSKVTSGERPPVGMYVNHDDLVLLASSSNAQADGLLRGMEREIESHKRTVQSNKQAISAHANLSNKKSKIEANAESEWTKFGTDDEIKIAAKWTNEELLLGVQGIRKFGKDFKSIADVIGTKSEAHVRSFFVNYRRRYNLDAALKEFEAESGMRDTNQDDSVVDSNNVNDK